MFVGVVDIPSHPCRSPERDDYHLALRERYRDFLKRYSSAHISVNCPCGWTAHEHDTAQQALRGLKKLLKALETGADTTALLREAEELDLDSIIAKKARNRRKP